MGYFGRHFCKRRQAKRSAGKEAPTRVPLLLDEIILDEIIPEPVPTEPAWTVTAPNRPPLVVRAESETAARKAARESWGLARLPNGASVAAV